MVGALQQTSVAPAVKRTADGLTAGFIAPAAGGRGDLGERQTSVVGKVEGAVQAQAKALADAADKILDQPPVEPERFQPLSPAEAVLRYAGDFVPSWAGAIAIDLMPAVLVLVLCVVEAGIRRDAEPAANASNMTAAELIMALQLVRELDQAGKNVSPETREKIADAAAAPVREPEQNVTALPIPRAKKD